MTKKRRINYFIPIAVIVGIGAAIYTSSRPFKVYGQEKGKVEAMRTELDLTQKSNSKLRGKDQLMNPVQKEEAARRLGYVRPDERPLPDKSSNVAPPKVESTPSVPKKPEQATPPIELKEGDKNEEVEAGPQ